MSKSQRDKGARFERLVANDLTDRLGFVVKRNLSQVRDSGCDIQIGRLLIECKARKGIASLAWLEQVRKVCKEGERGIVVMKADGKPWAVLMDYETAVELIRGDLQ